MSELGTAIATAGAVGYVGKDLLNRVLGPTADYLGSELKEFAERRLKNIKTIFEKADSRLGSESVGKVPPRVLKEILDEGSFCDDEISQEYYAGILSSSKSDNNDDRGVALAKTLNNLSRFQIFGHYFIYGMMNAYYTQYESTNTLIRTERFFIDNDMIIKHLCLTELPENEQNSILEHIFFGLHKHGLVSLEHDYGLMKGISVKDQQYFLPTYSGIELFLWANSAKNKDLDFFYSRDFEVYELEGISFWDYL